MKSNMKRPNSEDRTQTVRLLDFELEIRLYSSRFEQPLRVSWLGITLIESFN